MRKIAVANWKMNPDTLQKAEDLFRASGNAIVCPPFIYLEELSKIRSGVILGSQDISPEFSGETLRQLGIKYVIIGHSDRRWGFGESDEAVNKKLKLALEHELVPIVCIGEKSRDRNFGMFLQNQTIATFAGLSVDDIQKCLIAYEPVWAISTAPGARPDTPESAIESIKIIQNLLSFKFQVLSSKFLYGGSVTSANAKDFLSLDEISGVLVGRASLNKEEFSKIIKIASSL